MRRDIEECGKKVEIERSKERRKTEEVNGKRRGI